MCQSFEEEFDHLYRRHQEFHAASRIVNVERLWAVDPAQYNEVREAADAVIAAKPQEQFEAVNDGYEFKGMRFEKRPCRVCGGSGRKGLGPCTDCKEGVQWVKVR